MKYESEENHVDPHLRAVPYTEVMPGQQIRYDFSGIGNNSTTSLTSFYWRDTLPTQAVRLDKIVTGTYNVPGNYKVVYKTNLNQNYRTMYDIRDERPPLEQRLPVYGLWGKRCERNKIQRVLRRMPVIGPYRANSSHRLSRWL